MLILITTGSSKNRTHVVSEEDSGMFFFFEMIIDEPVKVIHRVTAPPPRKFNPLPEPYTPTPSKCCNCFFLSEFTADEFG